jgi:hypothetical protein
MELAGVGSGEASRAEGVESRYGHAGLAVGLPRSLLFQGGVHIQNVVLAVV